jgi:plastocyanin
MGRTRRVAVLALAVAASVLVAACDSGTKVPGPSDGASLQFDSKATVTIDDNGISPGSLDVHVGDAITVVNKGTRDHGLTSKTIDTGTLRPGDSTVVYFTTAGNIDANDRDAPDHKVAINVLSGTA